MAHSCTAHMSTAGLFSQEGEGAEGREVGRMGLQERGRHVLL